MHYYNDNDPQAVDYLMGLTGGFRIRPGIVDGRDIRHLTHADVENYDVCHFFAGVGGWDAALRLCGWSFTDTLWTGSCPCQPFSSAGSMRGSDDVRHLWPVFYELISQCRPSIIFGEQVATPLALLWLSRVRSDLEKIGYAVGSANLCAAGIGAPHTRQRLYWGAYSAIHGCKGVQYRPGAQVPKDGTPQALGAWHGTGSPFEQWPVLLGESHVCRVANGVSSTVDIRPRLHAYGNTIIPWLGSAFIDSFCHAMKAPIRAVY